MLGTNDIPDEIPVPSSFSQSRWTLVQEKGQRQNAERDQFMWVNREGGADPKNKRSV